MEALRQYFTPEFLGRLDAVISFTPLQQETLEKIAWKYLEQLRVRAAANGVQLCIPEEVAWELSARVKQQSGARQIRRLVQERVEGPLAMYLLKCGKKTGKIKIKVEEGKLIFQGGM